MEEEKQGHELQNKVMIVLGIIALGVVAVIFFGNFGQYETKEEIKTEQSISESQSIDYEKEKMTEELIIEDIVVGDGDEAVSGAKITVNYEGTLTDGTKFDSSYDRDLPFTLIFGVGQVIPGWDEGLKGMKVGGKRKLTIPSEMGYGEAGAGDVIPPNATLIFEVELLEVESPGTSE